jgi:ADP-ribosyl-[dinitrogen reductase] hydrolase
MSVNGEVFDVGGTTKRALMRFYSTSETRADTTDDEFEAGNGSLMRIAPIPILFGSNLVTVRQMAEQESATTHACPSAIWCCQVLSILIALCFRGVTKERMLEYIRSIDDVPKPCEPIVRTDFLNLTHETIPASGWVVHTLQVTLWAFFGTETFEDGLIAVVNLGGDADTNGAVFGALAGAFYGYDAIPDRWSSALQKMDMVQNVFTEFAQLAEEKWKSQTE